MRRLMVALILLAAVGGAVAIAQTIPFGMDPNGGFTGMNARNAAWAGKADLNPAAVSCPAGTISLTTMAFVNGVLVHC
jgi:hypothetical protein